MPKRNHGQGRPASPSAGPPESRQIVPFASPCAAPTGESRGWRIGEHRAYVLIWTDDEMRLLRERPADAVFYPSARVWAALRYRDSPGR